MEAPDDVGSRPVHALLRIWVGAVGAPQRSTAQERRHHPAPHSRELLGSLVRLARAPADRDLAGVPDRRGELGVAGGVGLGDKRDNVGQLGGRLEVTERGKPSRPIA